MRMVDLIDKKRKGNPLTEQEISFIVNGYTREEIPDYQMSAFLMAVCLIGMTPAETAIMTKVMMESGTQVDLSIFGNLSMDKHSTGGVGDKTTLVVAPLVAAAGGKVAKMSGRGLGFTGGTIDKLESIPGFRTDLTPKAFMEQVEAIGCAVVSQTGDLAAADKKIYALRDVTATVESIPLIAASIMSKKLAAGARNIVLDVKTGRGAFMKDRQTAEELARSMITIGQQYGRRVTAVLTDMNTPLGYMVGNGLEVKEAVCVLKNQGPADTTALCKTLAAEMLSLGKEISPEEAARQVEEVLISGKALAVFRRWVQAQGGDDSFVEYPQRLPGAAHTVVIPARTKGFVIQVNALEIGHLAGILGAGRFVKQAQIDLGAGVELKVKPGSFCQPGQPLAVLHTNRADCLGEAKQLCEAAIELGENPPETVPLVLSILRN